MLKIRNLLLLATMGMTVKVVAQRPAIISADRVKSGMAETVTLSGRNFGTNASQLRVFFGGATAQIKSVSDQLLEVSVPAGTTYDNISITNTSNGLTGYSSWQHLLSFRGNHGITADQFSTEITFDAERGLYDLCLCDFNNDGKTDIGTASNNSASFTLFQGGSTIANIALTGTKKAIAAQSLHIACGDLNGDGRPDMVVSESEGSRIFLFRNDGNFNFNTTFITLNGRNPNRLAIADLDLDGKPEIVATDTKSNIIIILPNKSTTSALSFGNAVAVNVPEVDFTGALEVKDLNDDGLPEIITSQYQTQKDHIFVGVNKSSPGNFDFTDFIPLLVEDFVIQIRAGDLDHDGKTDIAVTRYLNRDVAVFRNTGTGSSVAFSSPTSIPFSTDKRPWGMDFGDLDGDGKTDIAVNSIEGNGLVILNNNSTPGSINFNTLAVATATVGRAVRIGDLDTDGKPDIAIVNVDGAGTTSKLSVLRNRACVVPELLPLDPSPICSGFAFQLTTTRGGGITYEWKKGGSTVSTGTDPFLNIDTSDPAGNSGEYTVVAISESNACQVESNPVTININPPGTGLDPGDPNARSNGPICTGNALNLMVERLGAEEIHWRGPAGFTSTDQNPVINNFQLENAGEYIVELYADGCLAKTDTTVVEGVSLPEFTITFSGTSQVCEGSLKTLNVSPLFDSGYTYQWFKDEEELAGKTQSSCQVGETGEYYAKVKSSFPGCAEIQTPSVVITAVQPPTVAFTAPATACTGQEITFANTSSGDPNATLQYTWTFGDGSATSNEAEPVHKYTAAGNYNVKLRVTYEGAVCPMELDKPVEIIQGPALFITNPENRYTLCDDETIALEVSGGTIDTYLWNTGATTPTIEVSDAGEYWVEATTPDGCVIKATRIIKTFPSPTVTAMATPEQIKVGESTQLQATGALLTYTWRPGESVEDSTAANTFASPIKTTVYKVFGRDVNGCYGEGTVEVVVLGSSAIDLIAPKAYFTPNGDDINAYWIIDNIADFAQCGVYIYNDKGVKVFEAKPYLNNWDGTFKGIKLPRGVYYYVIRCDDSNVTKTGSITLLR